MDAASLALTGDLTIYQVQQVRDQLRQAWEQGVRRFDASALASLDAAGAQLLLSLHKTGSDQGQPVQWLGWSEPARQTLALLGLRLAEH